MTPPPSKPKLIAICPNCLMVKGVAIRLQESFGRYYCRGGCASEYTENFLRVSQVGLRRMAEAMGYGIDNDTRSVTGKSTVEREIENARIVESGGRYIELPNDKPKKS